MPSINNGDSFPLTEETFPMKEMKTEPPGYLTESELIGLMERNGKP
jgi:DNA topoisomerase IA